MLANIKSQRTFVQECENTFSNDDDEEEDDGDDNDINNGLAQSSMWCLYLSKENLHTFFFSIHTWMPRIRVPYYFKTFILGQTHSLCHFKSLFIHIYQGYTSQLRLAFFFSYELTYCLYYWSRHLDVELLFSLPDYSKSFKECSVVPTGSVKPNMVLEHKEKR